MTYTAVLHPAEEGGFWATCLEVPGANGQGESREECLADLAQAVKLLLETERATQLAEDADAELVPLLVA